MEHSVLFRVEELWQAYEQPALKADVDSTPTLRIHSRWAGLTRPEILCSKVCAAQLFAERSSSEFPIAEMPLWGHMGTLPLLTSHIQYPPSSTVTHGQPLSENIKWKIPEINNPKDILRDHIHIIFITIYSILLVVILLLCLFIN